METRKSLNLVQLLTTLVNAHIPKAFLNKCATNQKAAEQKIGIRGYSQNE